MIRAEYEVTTHRCPACQTRIARHSSLFTHVEPVIRRCPKCGGEVVVATCNEWELLSEKQRAIYDLRLMQRMLYRGLMICLTITLLAWILRQTGCTRELLYLLPGEWYFTLMPVVFRLANPLVAGTIALLVVELVWLGTHLRTVRRSRQRMADPEYRTRVTDIIAARASQP